MSAQIYQPRTVTELASLLDSQPQALLLGGGTLAIPAWQKQPPPAVIYLPAVSALREQGENWCGSATTLSRLLGNPRLPDALRQAIDSIGSPAVRNMATVGGNIAANGPRCVAVALLMLNATVDILDANGKFKQHSLEDVLGQIHRPIARIQWQPAAHTIFLKLGVRAIGGPNLASVAVCWGGQRAPEKCIIAAGSIGSHPHRLRAAEQAWLRLADDPAAAAQSAAESAAATVRAVSDLAATADYRRHVVSVLVRRALTTLTQEGGSG